MNNKQERLATFDSFKGIAILGVILVHSGASNLPGIWGKIGSAGARGIQIFFIISAYFIFASLSKLPMYDGRYKKGACKIWCLKRFFGSSLSIIFPIYTF